jgi:hypothetical protein
MPSDLLTESDVRELLRREIGQQSQQLWAYRHGFAPSFVGDVIKGRRRISRRMCEALGVEQVYRKKEGKE